MGLISKMANDKVILILFLIVISLGVFVRLNDFYEVSYQGDDQATLPAGLMWFYKTSYFPGLNYGNPPIGDMIIGAGCMLSGEDFSGVSQVQPFFYPSRFPLLGKALSKSNTECHLSMYIFGIIFFIGIILFSLTFFNKYSALFLISFFAFSPLILRNSRWIKPDIIFWTFTIFFMFFLLKYYKKGKNSNIILSSIFIGLAFATKFTALMLFAFAILIITIKNKEQFLSLLKLISNKLELTFLNNLNYASPKKLIKDISLFSIFFAISKLIHYKFNPKNIIDTYNYYQNYNQGLGGIKLSLSNIFLGLKQFILTLNEIEIILFLVTIYFIIKLIMKKEKTNIEIFSLLLLSFSLLTFFLLPVMSSTDRAFPLLFGIIFLISLTLEKINNKYILISFLVIHIILSSSIAISSSPYFQTTNHLICPFIPEDYNCNENYIGFQNKILADYLSSILKDDETFVGDGGVLHFYIRPEQGYLDYIFDQSFQQQVGRYPTIFEKAAYFRPNNQTARYLILSPNPKGINEETEAFQQKYKPLKIIKINNKVVSIIYDLKNLEENGTK